MKSDSKEDVDTAQSLLKRYFDDAVENKKITLFNPAQWELDPASNKYRINKNYVWTEEASQLWNSDYAFLLLCHSGLHPEDVIEKNYEKFGENIDPRKTSKCCGDFPSFFFVCANRFLA